MIERVLVTGGTGFIGRWAVAGLAARGYEVHLCSRRGSAEQAAAFALHRVDLLSEGAATDLLEQVRPTRLMHLAWETSPGSCWTSDRNLSWAASTLSLVRAAVSFGCKRIVAVGTCAEYDWSVGGVLSERCLSTIPGSLYGAAKAATFQALQAFASTSKVSFAWTRLFHQYGPYEHPDRLIPSVIRSVLVGRKACCSHGEQMRDFMYSLDTGDALAAVMESDVNGVLNIGSGRLVRVKEIVMKAAMCAGGPELVHLNARAAPEDEPLVLVPDVARLQREVGWTPRFSLEEGLRRTVEFWRTAMGRGESWVGER